MRLVKEHVLRAWEQRKAEIGHDAADTERRAKTIQQKLDRLDEGLDEPFLFAQSIDIDTYDRHKDKLRQELTLLQIDQHAGELEKFDVEGILAFTERVLPRASDLSVEASLDQRQRLQQLFFPDGVVFDGNRFVRTGVSTHGFRHLPPVEPTENNLASLAGFEPAVFALKGRRVGPATPQGHETILDARRFIPGCDSPVAAPMVV
jgi:hypothetical protein